MVPKRDEPRTSVVRVSPQAETTETTNRAEPTVEVTVEPAAAPRDGALDAAEPADPDAPSCPHCGAPLIDHERDAGPKENAWHCDNCGGCFVHRGSAWFSREGHPAPDGWAGR